MTDDRIAEIRRKHNEGYAAMHEDVAFLLAEFDRLRAQVAERTEQALTAFDAGRVESYAENNVRELKAAIARVTKLAKGVRGTASTALFEFAGEVLEALTRPAGGAVPEPTDLPGSDHPDNRCRCDHGPDRHGPEAGGCIECSCNRSALTGEPFGASEPVETRDEKLLRDIFTDPAQRKSVYPRGTLEGQDWAKPENPVSTPLGVGVIDGVRFDDAGYEWWAVRVNGKDEVFRPEELAPVGPVGDDEGEQKK